MTGNLTDSTSTRDIKEILEELFKGKDAALSKYARVRLTKYEIGLWRSGLPITGVSPIAKQCFSKSFLGGKRILNASPEELTEAQKRLNYAVSDGCHGRCIRLVEELNCALEAQGLQRVSQPEKFLDWLTFSYEVKADYDGRPIREQLGGFEIRIFHSEENRKEFWAELQALLKQDKMMSMQDVAKIVMHKRHHSKSLKKPEGST